MPVNQDFSAFSALLLNYFHLAGFLPFLAFSFSSSAAPGATSPVWASAAFGAAGAAAFFSFFFSVTQDG